ncbi:MAG TPA: hypothetical protein VMU90_06365 [Solirubrobacteraceae bacterium]|nr:hypothetical protein [Solirubrobacteraceae bacterium]
MAPHEQHARELRLRLPYAVIAGVGGIALFAAAALTAVGPQPKVSELTLELIVTNKRVALEVAGAVINGLGLVALGLTLNFVGRAAQERRPQMTQAPRLTALAGGAIGAVGGIAYGIAIAIKAHQFVTSAGALSYVQANSLVGGGTLAVLQYLGLVGSLLLAIAFVLVSLNAMRVGLLTRFLGYLGMVAAAASLLLIGSAPALLIEVFWLLAIAYLLSGRWTSGEPESWGKGEAVPWPSSAEMREQRQRAGGARGNARAKPQSRTPAKPASSDNKPATTVIRTRASTPKRKRKRRK